jgi:hypothetical protein
MGKYCLCLLSTTHGIPTQIFEPTGIDHADSPQDCIMSQAIKSRLFAFKGTNRNGDKVAGEIKSEDLVKAKRQLRKQGVICTSVKKKANPYSREIKRLLPLTLPFLHVN